MRVVTAGTAVTYCFETVATVGTAVAYYLGVVATAKTAALDRSEKIAVGSIAASCYLVIVTVEEIVAVE